MPVEGFSDSAEVNDAVDERIRQRALEELDLTLRPQPEESPLGRIGAALGRFVNRLVDIIPFK